MGVVSQVGAFTNQAAAAINASLQAVAPDFYVDGDYGFDGNDGLTPSTAFKSPGPLNLKLAEFRRNNNTSREIVVGLSGVINYEWSTPKVNDVKLVGLAGQPRQATTSGVANGGGCSWLSPTGGAAALLQPNGQGWTVENVFFSNSATAAPCIQLVNVGDPPTNNCSERFTLLNCTLTGSDEGISSTNQPNNIRIENCEFFGFSGAGDLAIAAVAGGVGTLRNWQIRNCVFNGNAGHITAPLTSSEITGCKFSYIYGSTTSTTQVLLSGGENNSVHDNAFDLPHNTNGISAMFSGGTNDRWYFNRFATAVTTTIFAFSVPAT